MRHPAALHPVTPGRLEAERERARVPEVEVAEGQLVEAEAEVPATRVR